MNKYMKDNVVIRATEKAYNLLYKSKGFIPYKEKSKKKEEADK